MPSCPEGLTPIMIALREGHFEVSLRLLEMKVELRTTDHDGLCALDHVKESDRNLVEVITIITQNY